MDERDEPGIDDRADHELGELLGRYADDLTGRVDVEDALGVVQQRAGTRRRWRVATTTLGAAAAAAVLVVGAAAFTGDGRATVQTPAATDVVASVVSTVGPTPATVAVTTPTMPATTPTASVTPPPTSLPAVPGVASTTPSPPSTAVPTTQAASTSTFSSTGGSIVVRLDGGGLVLDGDPAPAAGWTSRIDDDGPTRVRVRFERDGRRSEIRVDVRDGEVVPEIIEQ